MQQLLASNWQVFDSINDHAGFNHLLDQFMIFSANDLVFGMAAIVLVWWLAFVSWSPARRWMRGLSEGELRLALRTLVLTPLAVGLAIACNLTIEQFLFEPRPFVSHPNDDILLISHAADGSFPSDHTGVAFAITMMILLYVGLLIRYQTSSPHDQRRSLAEWGAHGWMLLRQRFGIPALLGGLALGAALDIGYARIFVGVHYPVDIIGGMATGSLSACAITWFGMRFAKPIDRLLVVAQRWRLA